jgi:hypothetical protein
MKKAISHILSVILLSFLQWNLYAQESINITGKDISGDGGAVSYSVGQIVYHSQADGNYSITEGVQQPYEISVVGIDDAENIQLTMKVFPNPVENQLNLSIETGVLFGYSYQLTDMEGRMLQQEKITYNHSVINLIDFASSTYFVSIWQLNKKLKTFKIIKK